MLNVWPQSCLGRGVKAETLQVQCRPRWQQGGVARLKRAPAERVDGVTYGAFGGTTNMGTTTMRNVADLDGNG